MTVKIPRSAQAKARSPSQRASLCGAPNRGIVAPFSKARVSSRFLSSARRSADRRRVAFFSKKRSTSPYGQVCGAETKRRPSRRMRAFRLRTDFLEKRKGTVLPPRRTVRSSSAAFCPKVAFFCFAYSLHPLSLFIIAKRGIKCKETFGKRKAFFRERLALYQKTQYNKV